MEANPDTCLVELMITNEFGSRFYNATDLETSSLGEVMDAIRYGLLGAGYAQSAIDKYIRDEEARTYQETGSVETWPPGFYSEPE